MEKYSAVRGEKRDKGQGTRDKRKKKKSQGQETFY